MTAIQSTVAVSTTTTMNSAAPLPMYTNASDDVVDCVDIEADGIAGVGVADGVSGLPGSDVLRSSLM